MSLTTVFGIRKFDSGEPARNTATIINQHADLVEAALVRGGIAPTDTQALLAKWPGTWQTMPLRIATTGFVATGAGYRREAGRVYGTGWAQAGTSGIAANATLLATPLPAEYRPTIAREGWAILDANPARPHRVIVNPDGTLTSVPAIAAGLFLNFDNMTWPLG